MATDKPQSTADEIMAGMASAMPNIEVFHNQVLVGIYMAPGVTKGGIILTDKTRAEDQWQGKVGLVLAKGPLAFLNDARNDFKDQNVEQGQWVIYRVSDGFPIDINGVHCRLIEDIHIRGRITDPSLNLIW